MAVQHHVSARRSSLTWLCVVLLGCVAFGDERDDEAGRSAVAAPEAAVLEEVAFEDIEERQEVAGRRLEAPIVLKTPGETHTLTENLVASGAAVRILADDVTLDLGGHTVFYDHGASGLANPSFETPGGTPEQAAGWDLSGAPGAARASTFERAMVGRWFVRVKRRPADQALVSDWAEMPPSTDAAAYFARGDPSWKYDIRVRLEVEHEHAGVIAALDDFHEHYVEFRSLAAPGRYRVRWTWVHEDAPRWQPGNTYSIGDMVVAADVPTARYRLVAVGGVKKGTSGNTEPEWPPELSAEITDGALTWKAHKTSIVERPRNAWQPGAAYGLGGMVHPRVANGYAYKVVRIRVDGAGSGPTPPAWTVPPMNVDTADGDLRWQVVPHTDCRLDLLDIRTKGRHGIYTRNSGVTIRNGSIVQGAAEGFRSHAVKASGTKLGLEDLRIRTYGLESAGISANYTKQCRIVGNDVRTASPHKFNRHQLSAAVTAASTTDALIAGNRIASGEGWGGIYSHGTGAEILNNHVWTRSVLTNHYGIIGSGTRNRLFGNRIDADPGQGLRSDGDGNLVEGNTIVVHSVAPNWDIDRYSLDAIRINDYNSGRNRNLVLRGNRIWVFGRNSPHYVRKQQILCGICNVSNGPNNLFEENHVRAVEVDSEVVVCGVMPGSKDELVTWRANTIDSDEHNIVFGAYAAFSYNARFERNRLVKGENAVPSYATVRGFAATRDFMRNTAFIDTELVNGATLRAPDIPFWMKYEYAVRHRIDVKVEDGSGRPLPGVGLELSRRDEIVATARTGPDGLGVFPDVPDFTVRNSGSKDPPHTYVEHGPYVVTAVHQGKTATAEVGADANRRLTIVLAR
jgi:hypothetical protein